MILISHLIYLPICQIIKLDCNNQYIIDNLPNSIKIIKFDKFSKYNKKLNNLPKSLDLIYIPERLKNNIENLNPNCKIIRI